MIIPRDGALPQLATVLDPQAMRSILAARLWATAEPGGSYALAACDIERVRYKPGRSCMVSYRLALEHRRSGERAAHLLTARAYPIAQSSRRFAKTAGASGDETASFGPSVMHIPGLGLIGWGFPRDRKIVNLGAFVDADRLAGAVLPPVVRGLWGAHARLERCRATLVHYVPEQGCTVRAGLTAANPGCTPATATVFGKTYAHDPHDPHDPKHSRSSPEGPARAHDNLIHIARHLAMLAHRGVAALPTVPPVVLHQPERHALWTAAIEGVPLAEIRGPEARIGEVGRAIAVLHGVPIDPSRQLPLDPVERLRAAVALIGAVRGDLVERLARIERRLGDALGRDAASPPVSLHGDLHAGNILAGEAGIGLVDFDAFAAGPAAFDVGGLLASLAPTLIANDRRTCATRLADLRDRLLAGYREGARAIEDATTGARSVLVPRITATGVDVYVAYALVAERAARAISRMKPGRAESIDAMLDLAEALLP